MLQSAGLNSAGALTACVGAHRGVRHGPGRPKAAGGRRGPLSAGPQSTGEVVQRGRCGAFLAEGTSKSRPATWCRSGPDGVQYLWQRWGPGLWGEGHRGHRGRDPGATLGSEGSVPSLSHARSGAGGDRQPGQTALRFSWPRVLSLGVFGGGSWLWPACPGAGRTRGRVQCHGLAVAVRLWAAAPGTERASGCKGLRRRPCSPQA